MKLATVFSLILLLLSSCGPLPENKLKVESLQGEDTSNQVACVEVYEPVCGADGNTYSNTCHAGIAGVNVQYQGECQVQQNCNCPMNYDPVCGSDSRTYSNSCAASCAQVTYSSGACE